MKKHLLVFGIAFLFIGLGFQPAFAIESRLSADNIEKEEDCDCSSVDDIKLDILDKEFDRFGVFIRDWKREISITQLRQLHKACLDSGFQGGIMICNQITDFSREYSSQFGLQLLSKGHLISMLRNRQFQNDF